MDNYAKATKDQLERHLISFDEALGSAVGKLKSTIDELGENLESLDDIVRGTKEIAERVLERPVGTQ